MGRCQHVSGADEGSPTKSLAGGGSLGAQAEEDIPGKLMRTGLVASRDLGGSVDLATVTFHPRRGRG